MKNYKIFYLLLLILFSFQSCIEDNRITENCNEAYITYVDLYENNDMFIPINKVDLINNFLIEVEKNNFQKTKKDLEYYYLSLIIDYQINNGLIPDNLSTSQYHSIYKEFKFSGSQNPFNYFSKLIPYYHIIQDCIETNKHYDDPSDPFNKHQVYLNAKAKI
ncbi:hypothetical protein [Belliella pelovolcani]|uniref:Lipoprotein n=1 Tax=Belliella pelovolcani TaxID=529505 RepID=A0A1N7MQU8_9BACT|nr:hypothetical protein [Belliella pelovolcani]SIS88398.1 hypothetical protein SAMN05421761_10744 [Belliella pelovolcani]